MRELFGLTAGAISGVFIIVAITLSALQPKERPVTATVSPSEPKVAVAKAPAPAPASAPVAAAPTPTPPPKLTPYQGFKKQWADVESALEADPFRLRDAEILAMYDKLYTEVAKIEPKKKAKSKHPKAVDDRLRDVEVFEKTEAPAVVDALNKKLSKN